MGTRDLDVDENHDRAHARPGQIAPQRGLVGYRGAARG